MVTKIVNGDTAGNLNNAADFFGVQDDFIAVQAAGSPIFTFDGNDRIDASRSTGLQTAYLGFGNDTYRGGITGGDFVHDGDGADFVDLAGGDDTANAGAGNDVLRGGAGTDTITFLYESNDGYGALVQSGGPGIVIDLAKTTAQNFGRFGVDTISGFESVLCSGGADKIYGTNGANGLNGYSGNDVIDGRGGNDNILGASGADIVIGGLGGDTIFLNDFGDDGVRDTVRYLSTAESGLTVATRDVVSDFVHSAGAGGDRIDLSRIDANPFLAGNQSFAWRATLAFRANVVGEVRFIDAGNDVMVQVDTDNDNAAEMTILVKFVPSLAAYDFVL
ncbi:MAG TPA: calcium-binding protein [Rhizobiaceae bacterium]|nr:calcium-binding protein [Rhizobiaceae bacterium]